MGTIANVKPRPCKADENGSGCQCPACMDRRVEAIVKADREKREGMRK